MFVLSAEGLCADMAKKTTPTQKLYKILGEVDSAIKGIVLAGVWQMRETSGKLANVGKLAILASISKKGSYKPYYKNGKKRYSSQPGTPPAAEKGEDLEPTIYSEIKSKNNQNPAVAEFGSTAPFAAKLEFGTPSIPARPFLLPARQAVAQVAREIVMQDLSIAYAKKAKKMKASEIKFEVGL
jgi:hypothetical protein